MSENRPNLVFIITDQQRADTVGAWGHRHMETPAIDSLVEGGLSFRQSHCPGATCTASRAAIFTGMYAHNTGTYSFRHWGHQRTWVQDLAEAGYWCVNMGKMHFQPRDVSGGFHERVIVENPTSVGNWGGHGDDAWGNFLAFHGERRPNHRHQTDPEWKARFQCVPWHLDESLHSDAFTADATRGWIRQRKASDGPFFLQLGFPGPHEPWDAPQRFVDLYEGKDLPDPVDFPCALADRPPQHEAIRRFHAGVDHESRIAMPEATPAEVRKMQRHYYGKISFVDYQIGRVLDALREQGLLDNTVVIFTSDHGEMLGDHGSAYKWLMYDAITRVPLVVKDFRRKTASRQSDDLVSLMDLGPTILELAGQRVPTRLEGRSLVPYLEDRTVTPREAVYCEDNYMVMRRTRTEKIVHYIGAEYGEFYDLANDPHETRNLWDEPADRARRREAQVKVLDWLAASTYHNYGYKGRHEDADGQYSIRWHTGDDADLHGDNYRPKGGRFF